MRKIEGSFRQKHGSTDPDPNPDQHQNVKKRIQSKKSKSILKFSFKWVHSVAQIHVQYIK
jgi:hypothetical protein